MNVGEMIVNPGAIDALNEQIVPLLSNDSTYISLTQNVNQNSSYTVPADGIYSLQCTGEDDYTSAIWYLNSARTAILLTNSINHAVGILIPLKKNTTIYTRASYGSYRVNGYYPK